MSKYEPLWKYVLEYKCEKLSFEEIRNILGFDIDHSFLTYKKEFVKFGCEVIRISMKEKIIYFKLLK